MTPAPTSQYADRGVCIDLHVTHPTVRSYLISLESPEQEARWRELLEQHVRFAELFPDNVVAPGGFSP